MPRVRIHQHVNPLAPYYRLPVEPVDFERAFADPSLPLHLDIGSARGRFLLKMAAEEPGRNFLGLEIREPLVDEANRLAAEAGLRNLHYKFCNATLFLSDVLSNMRTGSLQTVTIQFPDPWYKKKHAKRRMVKDEMIRAIAEKLVPRGQVFIQTDVDFLAEEMFEYFRFDGSFEEIEVTSNPFPVRTERESAVEEKGLPVYRRMFVRK
jgi:tRNA (guanine-N7-)-methyltransferase